MKRRRLGQHYLVDAGVVHRMVGYARIRRDERVLEIGTGKGVLTRELAVAGRSLEAYEIDRENYESTRASLQGKAVDLHLGDVFKESPKFDVLVSSLPYSESATFVEWLAMSRYSRAVVLLQEDFVKKITAPPGSRDYRGISALAQITSEIEVLERVGREAFVPSPKVNSLVVRFLPKIRLDRQEILDVHILFSLRRRKVSSVLAELGMEAEGDFGNRRVYSLAPQEVYGICGR